jgi:hypothetical protein
MVETVHFTFDVLLLIAVIGCYAAVCGALVRSSRAGSA